MTPVSMALSDGAWPFLLLRVRLCNAIATQLARCNLKLQLNFKLATCKLRTELELLRTPDSIQSTTTVAQRRPLPSIIVRFSNHPARRHWHFGCRTVRIYRGPLPLYGRPEEEEAGGLGGAAFPPVSKEKVGRKSVTGHKFLYAFAICWGQFLKSRYVRER